MAGYTGLQPTMTATGFPGDFDIEQSDIARRRALYQALLGQASNGNWGVALGMALRHAIKGDPSAELDTQEKDLGVRRSAAADKWFDSMPAPTAGSPAMGPPTAEGEMQPATPERQPSRTDWAKWSTQGMGLGAGPNAIAQMGIANALRTPKIEIRETGTGKPGESTYAKYDDQGNYLGPSGAPNKLPDLPARDKHIAALKAVFPRMTDQELNEMVDKDRQYTSTPAGVVPTRAADLYPGASTPPTNGGATAQPAAQPAGVVPAQPGAAAVAPAAPAPAPLKGQYAPPPLPPGAIPADPGNLKGQTALNNDVEKYGGVLDKLNIPGVQSALKDVTNLLAKYPKEGTLPGVGRVVNAIPSGVIGLVSDEGETSSGIVRRLRNEIAKMNAGLSQTYPELKNILEGLTLGTFNSEKAFRDSMGDVARRLNTVASSVDQRFDPQVVETFKSRKGGAGGRRKSPEELIEEANRGP